MQLQPLPLFRVVFSLTSPSSFQSRVHGQEAAVELTPAAECTHECSHFLFLFPTISRQQHTFPASASSKSYVHYHPNPASTQEYYKMKIMMAALALTLVSTSLATAVPPPSSTSEKNKCTKSLCRASPRFQTHPKCECSEEMDLTEREIPPPVIQRPETIAEEDWCTPIICSDHELKELYGCECPEHPHSTSLATAVLPREPLEWCKPRLCPHKKERQFYNCKCNGDPPAVRDEKRQTGPTPKLCPMKKCADGIRRCQCPKDSLSTGLAAAAVLSAPSSVGKPMR